MTDIRQQLLAAFDVELRDHLNNVRQALANAGALSAAELRDIFRRVHSLKGAARAIDFPAVETVADRLETVLADVLEDRLRLAPQVLAALHFGLDAIEDLGATLTSGGPAADPKMVLADIDARLAGRESTQPIAHDGQAGPAPRPPAATTAPASDSAVPELLRVQAQHIDELALSIRTLGTEIDAQDAVTATLGELAAEVRQLRQSWSQLGPALRRAGAATAALEDFGQRLATVGRRLPALARQQRQAAWAIGQAFGSVQKDVERVFLVPAGTLFDGFGHMMRDLARQQGKKLSFQAIGMEVEADRRVLQALKDPVMHLLRNAIGHGIETAEERLARGKPAEAVVSLELRLVGERLLLSVTDDGRGPDLGRIETIARQQGLIAAEEAAPRAAADQLLALVFEPGFSTAENVDALSGRGMGLSVVAEAARRLQGSVLMEPAAPHGTRVRISVPLSASRQSILLVAAAGQSFGIPTYGVERLLRLPQAEIEMFEGRPVVRLEVSGTSLIVPVVSLAALLELPSEGLPVENGWLRLLLLRRGERRCAVAVESLDDVRNLLVSGEELDSGRGVIAGTMLLEDNRPALLLEPEVLIERWLRGDARLAASALGLLPPETARARAPATILIVDDSITTRTLEKSILEAQGYQVILSVDGLEALDILRGRESLVDLVIADVEMPRMDGFALLQAMKQNPLLASIPVILMTSRATDEDVRRGLELGAGAYITKQKFDQGELLATIGQLL